MNKTIKIILGIVVLAIIVILVVVFYKPAPKEAIKIGFIGPLSGGAAIAGENELNAINLALEDLGNKIAGREVKIIVEDGKCDGKDAATAIQKLINIDGVKIILGGICSAETLGAAPIAESNKVILFSAFSSSPDITHAGDYIFRNDPSDADWGDIAKEMKEGKIAMISENSDYSMGIRKLVKTGLEELGKEVVADEVYSPGEKDFRTYVTKIKATNPQAIFINPSTQTTAAGMIAKEIREFGLNVVLYGNFQLGGADSLAVAKEAAEGAIIFDAPIVDPGNKKGIDFISKYKERYGVPYSEWEVAARYDTVFIIAKAIEKCGEKTDCIKDHLYSMSPYRGAVGDYKFDENGDVVGLKSFSIKKIVNGKPEVIK